MPELNTHQERLDYLAGLEVECPGYKGEDVLHDKRCCGSTGKVSRFPMLKKECSDCGGMGGWGGGYIPGMPEEVTMCEDCQGRGWVAVDNLEATLEAIGETPYKTKTRRILIDHISFQTSNGGWSCDIEGGKWTERCATPNEAAVLALYKMVIKEKEEGKCQP